MQCCKLYLHMKFQTEKPLYLLRICTCTCTCLKAKLYDSYSSTLLTGRWWANYMILILLLYSQGGGGQSLFQFYSSPFFTVNQGSFSCNYQAVNCKQVFLYSNSTVQTLKSTVSENSLMFLSWNHFPTKTTKCSLNFKNPLSTDLMTNLEIHVGSF